jgi:hypothetical protein
MAGKVSAAESEPFSIEINNPKGTAPRGDSFLDRSVGRLRITVDGSVISSTKSDKGDSREDLTIPMYDFAEWITSNWWSILYEPKKRDEENVDDGYTFRHWIGAARSGFALPDLSIEPQGELIELSAGSTYLRSARLTFTESAETLVSRAVVEEQLSKVADFVVDRLPKQQTPVHEQWAHIKATTDEQKAYCRLVGSLGLSPYDDNPEVTKVLQQLTSAELASTVLEDLFQAADASSLRKLAGLTTEAASYLRHSRQLNVSALDQMELPSDTSPWAWKRGKDATEIVRRFLGVAPTDSDGADKFFTMLGLDSPIASGPSIEEETSLSGLFDRDHTEMKVALIDKSEAHRRFAAARAAYLAWTSGPFSKRLLTSAVTRDQQASRAFAAELLAPFAYIKARGSQSMLSLNKIQKIAAELRVSPLVVQYQATNNGMKVVDMVM